MRTPRAQHPRRLAIAACRWRSPPALAACGEKEEDLGARRARSSSTWCSTSTSTPTTSRSTWRSSAATSSASASTCAPRVPSDPVGADQAGRRRARRPGDLLRARGAAGPRAGPGRGRGRRARGRAADLADVAARSRDRRAVPTCAARPWRPPGIPYQAAYLETILAGAGIVALRRRAGRTSGSTCCRRCSAARSTRPSAASGTSRAWSCASAASDPSIVPVNQLGVPDLRRAGPGRPGRARRGRPRGAAPLHRAPWPRGPTDAVADPQAATDAVARGRRRPRPGLTRAEVDGDAAAARADAGRALRAARLRGVGTVRELDEPTTG